MSFTFKQIFQFFFFAVMVKKILKGLRNSQLFLKQITQKPLAAAFTDCFFGNSLFIGFVLDKGGFYSVSQSHKDLSI